VTDQEVDVRLVDVHLDVDRPIHVVLHPRLTVITGDAPACTRLTEVLGRAFALAGTEVVGTLEFSGFPSPLDQTTVVSLDLPGEGLLVVTAADLPAPDRQRHDAAVQAALERRDHAHAESQRLAHVREQLSRRLQATEAAVRVGTEEQDATQRQLVELRERITSGDRALGEAEAGLVAQQERVVALGEQLAEQTVTLPAVLRALDPVEGSGRRLRLGQDVAAERQLVARAHRCGLMDEELAGAIDSWLVAVGAGRAPSDPVVAELRDEISGLEQRWNDQASVGVEEDPDVTIARACHDELAHRLAALEELSASGVLVEQARREIDEAHSQRAGARGRALEEAVAREGEVTARYGFASYLDYTIALSTRSVGDAVSATLEQVRAETVAAGEVLVAARERAAAIRHQLTEERAALRERFRELAGMDVESLSLESIRQIPAVPDELVGLGARLRAAVAAADQRRSEVVGEIERFDGWRARAMEEAESLRGELAARGETAAALAPLIQAAQGQHEEAADESTEVERQALAAASGVAAAEAELAALQHEDLSAYTAADVPVVVTHLGPLVDPPAADPVPVVLADTFRPLGVHATAALEAMMAAAVRVQIVYITDDPLVIGWARSLGETAGQLVRLHRPGWFQRRLARRGAAGEPLNQGR
jgi:hypothetical protein